MERTCEQCGKTFTAWKGWKANRFCSQECYHLWRPGKTRAQLADPRPPEERSCVACSKTFLVGGRGNRSRSTHACSVECARKAAYRSGSVARQMMPTEAAYVAGIIDGEGSIVLYMRRDVVAMMLMVTNCHRGMLQWLQQITGVGAVNRQAKETTVRRESGMWRCNAEAAATVLEQIQPYLVIKQEQCKLALLTQERLRDPQLKVDRTWQKEFRRRMQALNARGPRLIANTT